MSPLCSIHSIFSLIVIVLTSATLNMRLHFRGGCALTATPLPGVMLTSFDTSNLSTTQSPICLPCPDSAYSVKPFLLPMPARDLHSPTLVTSLFQKRHATVPILLQGIKFSFQITEFSLLCFWVPSYFYFYVLLQRLM